MHRSQLTVVTPQDTSVLRAIARRVLGVTDPAPIRHPSVDVYWEIERAAQRLAGYLAAGQLRIELDVPDTDDGTDGDDGEVQVTIHFEDGLDPISLPWSGLDLTLEPSRHER
ncbi:MAG: hypothetical protein KDB40_24305 [Acidimicrobiales bacterium]|nr:hypothetical protein [Acidimicrobiales bacterium]MCB9395350.1 hypothetical protein [Acidimicrobiaceae bacterium]